jgi:hypothetical protein
MECKDCTEHTGLEQRQKDTDKWVDNIRHDLNDAWKEIRRKVSLILFIPAMGLLLICIGGILSFQGVQVWKIANTAKETALVGVEVGYVKEAIKELKIALDKLPGRLNGADPNKNAPRTQ